jgi:hypothetical protein
VILVGRLLARVERRGAVGTDRLRVTTRFRDWLEIDGVERRTLEDELRVGMDRRVEGRETDREGARLGVGADFAGAELLFCRAWLLLLLLLLRELRREVWASAISDSSKTAATTRATRAVLQLGLFFTRNIMHLLSPAICFSGNPGLPFPHHRRHSTRHVRSSDI